MTTEQAPGRPELSVVVCSYNGAVNLSDCLDALDRQTVRDRIEIIVVDDGSTDDTAERATRPGVQVERHERNRGIAAARNTGLRHARAALVAYTDDDCQPAPDWAANLIEVASRHPKEIAFGSAITAVAGPGLIHRYLGLNNPLAPLEATLLTAGGLRRRLWLYLQRSTGAEAPTGERCVTSVAGAGMAIRREPAIALAGFDERFRFGGEEEDFFRRAARAGGRVIFAPTAVVFHTFEGTLRDTLRRSRAYGRGNARMYLKHRGSTPTLYPAPVLVAGAAAVGVAWWPGWLAAALLPQLVFSRWLRRVYRHRAPAELVFPYVQLLQEAVGNLGWLGAWWTERASFRGARTATGEVARTWAP